MSVFATNFGVAIKNNLMEHIMFLLQVTPFLKSYHRILCVHVVIFTEFNASQRVHTMEINAL